jgi:hypothetical protein
MHVALVGFDSRIWVSGDIYRPVYLTFLLGFDEIDQLSKRKTNTCGSLNLFCNFFFYFLKNLPNQLLFHCLFDFLLHCGVYILSINLLIPITLVALLVLGSAMELALSLEKLTNEKLLSLHSVIHLHFFLTSESS